ncbi:MAG TPA: EamA family transporter [Tissierella sp.]|uniref:DMT family transporter n=1 Tax=Tissierella praeacuta TaxID=43131 RepID=UPI000ECBA05B|nr:DMT family transporter [Tissierella praeacuta]HAE91298.1 EamA family transporter [Tissierella sp.]
MEIKSNRYKGIILAAIASMMWSTGGIFIKLVDWNPISISGFRSLIAALVMLTYIKKPKFTKSKPQILGSITTCTTMLFFIIANKLTTSANAILLQYTAPIFVAILGVWILKEKIQWYDIVSIIAVFLGMILFFIDNVNIGNTLGNIIAILSGFSMACMTISLRLQKDGSAIDTTFFGNMLTFIIAIPFIFISLPDVKSLIIIIIMGVFQLGIPYIFYVNATKYLSALEAILITVIEPLLNPLWVYIFAGEKPGTYAIIGGIVVIVTVMLRGIYVSKLEVQEE